MIGVKGFSTKLFDLVQNLVIYWNKTILGVGVWQDFGHRRQQLRTLQPSSSWRQSIPDVVQT